MGEVTRYLTTSAEVAALVEAARAEGAEAGIIGKVTARMGWIDMTTAEELIVYLEEQRAIRREVSP